MTTPNDLSKMTPEETIAMITELRSRGDRFLVKVGKRRGAAGVFETIAELAEATAFQISSPEAWLAQLLGGGEYRLKVYHMDNPTVQVGGFLTFQISGNVFQYPDPRTLERPEWLGPRVATFLGQPANAPALTAAPPATVPQYPPSMQPQPFVPSPAPQQFQAGYGAPAPQYAQPSPMQPPDWLLKRERELAEKEARIAREQAEKDAELKRIESENRLREEHRNSIRELELKIATQAKPASETKITDIITAVASVLTPLVATLNEGRKEAAAADRERQAAAERRAEAAAAETRELIKTLASKPGMSEETRLLIETLRAQGAGGAEMMSRFMDVTNAVTKNSVAMIDTISAMKFGDEPEHPAIIAVREGALALKTILSNSNSARRVAQPVQQMPQLTYAQAATAQAPSPMPQIQQVAAGAVATAPQQPFAGMPQQPAPQVAQPQQAAANGHSEQDIIKATAIARHAIQTQRLPSLEEDPLLILELAIKAHHSPSEVATYFFAVANHPKFKAALVAVNNEVDDLIKARLGGWLNDPQNLPYFMQLGAIIDDMGKKLGVFVEDDDQQDDDGGDDDQQADGPVVDSVAQPVQVVSFPAKK